MQFELAILPHLEPVEGGEQYFCHVSESRLDKVIIK